MVRGLFDVRLEVDGDYRFERQIPYLRQMDPVSRPLVAYVMSVYMITRTLFCMLNGTACRARWFYPQ